MKSMTLVLLAALTLIGCDKQNKPQEKPKTAKAFLEQANEELIQDLKPSSAAQWVQSTYITPDTGLLASKAMAKSVALGVRLANQSRDYKGSSNEQTRMLDLLVRGLTVPAPMNSEKNEKLASLKTELEAMYGSGKFCEGDKCKQLGDLEDIIAESRNPVELKKAWEGWRTISPPMKDKYTEVISLSNEGAKELGFKHTADLWQSKYDMPAKDFEKTLDGVWGEVKPLYEQLHCYVRGQLNKKYGDSVAPNEGPIPAHLLGNMWAQSWENITDITLPNRQGGTDITKLLEAAKYDPQKMVKTAENFFVSLGMPELPKTFYEKSMFVKPRDRDAVCHASAWHMDGKDDVRIKMCIKINEDNFTTIHHELGHIYYYLAYKQLPYIFQSSANDGFHEAIGDTIELSITPSYLKQINLTKSVAKQDEINKLLKMALKKIAFLPFGLMVDKWRWRVFEGTYGPANYNQGWWNLKKQYQGVVAPDTRPADAFDPGAKYHIPGFTPYSRYFIAHILQFQFHRALCKEAGFTGPLHECSIYNSKPAGKKLWKMLQMGLSKSWPEALEVATGQQEMDATAVREYFAPLETWLKEQNNGKKCGW